MATAEETVAARRRHAHFLACEVVMDMPVRAPRGKLSSLSECVRRWQEACREFTAWVRHLCRQLAWPALASQLENERGRLAKLFRLASNSTNFRHRQEGAAASY